MSSPIGAVARKRSAVAARAPAPARARPNAIDPVALHCLVGPKIDRDIHRRRLPCERLAKIDLEAIFLQPREREFEMPARRGASGCIDRHDGGPCPFHRRWPHVGKLDIRYRQRWPADVRAGMRRTGEGDAARQQAEHEWPIHVLAPRLAIAARKASPPPAAASAPVT